MACLLLIGLTGIAQTSNSPVNYGQPIKLYCDGAYGCGMFEATYTWYNSSRSWTYTAIGGGYSDPVILPTDLNGYKSDRFYLTIKTGHITYSSSITVIVRTTKLKSNGIKPPKQ